MFVRPIYSCPQMLLREMRPLVAGVSIGSMLVGWQSLLVCRMVEILLMAPM